ncbi:MAG: DNA translocase FtsK [Bacteroidales bacterium]|nr:DNA translocase FtsK [Bacteroidales bacterium]
MAASKKTTKKKKPVRPTREGGFAAFVRSPQFSIVCGWFFILFALFAVVAMVSNSILLLKFKTPPAEIPNSANWCGTIGSGVANLLMTYSFGIASLGLCFMLFLKGMRMVAKQRNAKRKKAPRPTLWMDNRKYRLSIISGCFWVLWLSVTLGWVANPTDPRCPAEDFAGLFGIYVAGLLYGWLHVGLPVLQVFLALAFVLLAYGKDLFPKRRERDDDERQEKVSQQPKNEDNEEDDEEEEKPKKGWLARLREKREARRLARAQDEDDDDDYDNRIDESDDDDWLSNLKGETPQTPQVEPQPEVPQSVTFDIDDEFERVNRRARGEQTPDGLDENQGQSIDNDPMFTVNMMPQGQNPTVENEDEEEMDPEDYRVHYGVGDPYDPKLDLKDFKMPNTDLLEDWERKNVNVTSEELVANKDRIVDTLRNYNIEIVGITATPGPTVTLYEIKPAPGIRISKIKNLEDDIALSLSALGIRIIAPIPGKGTIGIEVPNANPQIVSMKTMLNSDAFQNSKAELPIAFGKTISNDVFVTDLAKMPHLLMAGATGTGKSVGLNAVIASLLYKKHPAELKFIMVDPKKVELSLYNAIERHYLAKLPDSEDAIITDVKKVVRTLNSLCIEMDQRYDLLKAAKVRNLAEYNPKFINRQLNPEHGHRYLPYIVLVIDEFADLIMTAGKEVELPICRLAQLARAVGIHLIIATQRPTTNIITGAIKANFPARIAFRVISAIDSRTILDCGGANQLIGRGDMLISLAGKDLVRCQCALIETNEIERLAKFIGEQRGYAEGEGFMLPEYLDETDEPNKDFDPKQKDEYFNDAARLVVASQFGSTSLLQRKLQLGYNRAGRIIDQLEAAGIVGPYNGSKARDVLIKDEVSLEELLRSL